MDIQSTQKFIHTTPRKMRLVADMVKNLGPSQALDILNFTQKDAAKDLTKAIKTALGNAKQKGITAEKLVFKSIEINEGPKMRRFRAGTRGRVKPYKRRMSHVKIVLSDQQISGSADQKKTKTIKAEVADTLKTDKLKKEAK